MFCPKCGAQNPDDAKFCADCGASIARPATGPTVRKASHKSAIVSVVCRLAVLAAIFVIIAVIVPACSASKVKTFRIVNGSQGICFSTNGKQATFMVDGIEGRGDVSWVRSEGGTTVYRIDVDSLSGDVYSDSGYAPSSLDFYMPEDASAGNPVGKWGVNAEIGNSGNCYFVDVCIELDKDGKGKVIPRGDNLLAINKDILDVAEKCGSKSEYSVSWEKDKEGSYTIEDDTDDSMRLELSEKYFEDCKDISDLGENLSD